MNLAITQLNLCSSMRILGNQRNALNSAYNALDNLLTIQNNGAIAADDLHYIEQAKREIDQLVREKDEAGNRSEMNDPSHGLTPP